MLERKELRKLSRENKNTFEDTCKFDENEESVFGVSQKLEKKENKRTSSGELTSISDIFNNSRMTSTFPLLAATWRGENPSCLVKNTTKRMKRIQ
jgi:hypothetical protein